MHLIPGTTPPVTMPYRATAIGAALLLPRALLRLRIAIR
jgi:hypothetical protein